jgi:hypothetical protein
MPITNTDVMLGAEAQIFSLTKGGFIVRQTAGSNGTRTVDTYAADAAAVLALLTTIFTPPPAP